VDTPAAGPVTIALVEDDDEARKRLVASISSDGSLKLPGEVFDGSIRSIGVGVSAGQAPPAGTLPTIQNDRDWLRQSQRFPVIVEFDIAQQPHLLKQLRIGGQASVIAYGEGNVLLSLLGRLYIRMMSALSYAY
jgi:hypothetical protein